VFGISLNSLARASAACLSLSPSTLDGVVLDVAVAGTLMVRSDDPRRGVCTHLLVEGCPAVEPLDVAML